MKITASSLKQKNYKRSLIKEQVKSIIIAIEQNIIDAAENRLESCTIRVPAEFNIPGLSNSNAQLFIYTELIYELERHEFKVSIDPNSRLWTISGWNISVDGTFDRTMVAILVSRMKPKPHPSKNKSNK